MRRVVLVFAVLSAAVRADATHRIPPCSGCTLDVATSASADPVPLVVVLHGDTDNAHERADKWRDAVLARGWALLSLDCPAALGCTEGSWYRWDRGASWVRAQVSDVVEQIAVDTSRIYLVGWSGGATFIGQHLQEWPSTFAAAVIHGGGVPPRTTICPDRRFAMYFLVGDRNPDHTYAKRLRQFAQACHQDVTWDLVPGADHAREDAALTPAKADQVLAWLATKRRDDRPIAR